MKVATIGIDIAKNVFQVYGVCASGEVVVSKQLRRHHLLSFVQQLPPCTFGLEACPGAHHWARQIAAFGHKVRLMPPQYVKPYVKRQKNDAADAEAICEAVTRPTMRFVTIKTEDQQAILMLHRTRELLIRQKTMLINALRAHLSEFGVIATQGRTGLAELVKYTSSDERRFPTLARDAMLALIGQLKEATYRLTQLDQQIAKWRRSSKAPPPRDHSRRWSDNSIGHRGVRDRRQAVPKRATVRGLAGLGSTTELDGG